MTRYFKDILLGLLILLTLQNQLTLRPHFIGQDPAIRESVKEYKWFGEIGGHKFEKDPSIGFEKTATWLKPHEVGHCVFNQGFREIAIDPVFWNKSTPATRQTLLWHELTHCYCGRMHNEAMLPDGCPASIMSPQIPSDECVQAHYEDYFKDMYKDCNPY